jgi:hypothetical protein
MIFSSLLFLFDDDGGLHLPMIRIKKPRFNSGGISKYFFELMVNDFDSHQFNINL